MEDKLKKLDNIFVFLLLLFCFILIVIWFGDGKLLATGEEGLILANPQRTYELYKHSWIDVGTGMAEPAVRPELPFLYLASLSQKAGVPPWLFQANVFYLLMLTGVISIFFLVKEISFGNNGKYRFYLPFVASVFYLTNPISLLGVWYRFIYMFMFFFALAPLFFLVFLKGLKKRNFRYLILLLIVSFLFSYSFAAPALIALVWFFPVAYTLFFTLSNKSRGNLKTRIFPIFYLIGSLLFWIFVNLWWIVPYVSLSAFSYASESSPIHAIGTLKANSQAFSLVNVIRLIHGGFLYQGRVFGSIYNSLPFYILSWVIPALVFYGVIKLKKGVPKAFFLVSLVLLIFLAKGTSQPFGGLFLWLFKIIPPMQLYRNPLEKFGLLLPVVYAPLFAIGSVEIAMKIRKRNIKAFFWCLVAIVLVLTNWPFFTRAIVVRKGRDIRVSVPNSFKQASQMIVTGQHRILSLPEMGGASGRYSWEYGFQGIESSEFLYSQPVIAKTYYPKSFLGQVIIGISQGKVLNNLVGMAQFLSSDIIAVRKDTNLAAFGEYLNGLEISKKMVSNSNIKEIFDSKEVNLWKVEDKDIVPVIYSRSKVIHGKSPTELLNLLDLKGFDPKRDIYICDNKEFCDPYNSEINLNLLSNLSVPDNIIFVKLNPSEYQVKITGSQGKFLLVLANSFHPGWQLIIGGKKLSDDNHIEVNGYANGFIVDKTGNFTVDLIFAPQIIADKYSILSLVSFLFGAVGTLVISR
ncbi:hypothetical protein A3D00_00075 [Candidatus Woesebacteria bacterium RIFCSPHIGHO2_02_FULL_38_9]|nr:MAG: hypothetical protein A3D00_00075 [Candidatus Woesebacteria bacterium RIFCSPHIGHO2_02_FULL_38_9]OGM57838.1 MAG: hypothetical protein A3A50_02385 [Candidatus Woesebacteria bacterium RIFCSPLOWO2_01_FULL_38_20]